MDSTQAPKQEAGYLPMTDSSPEVLQNTTLCGSPVAQPQPYFLPIPYEELDTIDAHWLDKAVKMPYTGYELSHVLDMIEKDEAQLWRLRGAECEGVVVTCISAFPLYRELDVWLAAGKGMLKLARPIYVTLREFAKLQRCQQVRGTGLAKGLKKKYAEVVMPEATKLSVFIERI